MIKEAPNINSLWAQLIVEELIRNGITQFFIAPGSRSTPMVAAIARHTHAETIVHFDERGTAFAALGYGRVAGKPAVWVTTSGTAVANGLPAVVEASVDAVPLIVLTADRPPELRATGANQTIRQPGIFGDYVTWHFDGPAPDDKISPAFVLTTIDQAVHRSATGPVHLNWMFREPLAPLSVNDFEPAYLAPVVSWIDNDSPYTVYASLVKVVEAKSLSHVCALADGAQRGVIVAGRMDHPEQGKAVMACAERLGWPLLADVGSQVKLGYHDQPVAISHYDFLFGHITGKPDVILQFGRRSASKKLLAWMGNAGANHHVVVDNFADRLDPDHKVTLRIEADIVPFCRSLLENLPPKDVQPSAWLTQWQRKDEQVGAQIARYFEKAGNGPATEPQIARALAGMLKSEGGFVVANSMPVRDMDAFGRNSHPIQVVMNRGASGIDGIVATAAGTAIGLRKPVTLFTGDLSLLHDLNSLALLKQSPYPVIIVVVNNDGGGIFSFLPISSYKDMFERYFAVAHGLNFKAAAEMFGLKYRKPENTTLFNKAYLKSLQSKVSTLIEINTDREKNVAVHRAIENSLKIDA